MNIEKLGERLREARESKRLSLASLASRVTKKGLYVAPSTIGKIERGETELPRRELLMSMADELGVSAAYLLFGLEDLEKLSKEGVEFALAYSQLSEKQKVVIATLIESFKDSKDDKE